MHTRLVVGSSVSFLAGAASAALAGAAGADAAGAEAGVDFLGSSLAQAALAKDSAATKDNVNNLFMIFPL